MTGLRFIAALTVVFSHAVRQFMPIQGPPPLWYTMMLGVGAIGMSLFFVLSGFVIQYNYAESIKRERGRGMCNFFVARFARLYPLYIAAIAFDLLDSYSHSQTSSAFSAAIPYYLTLTQSWVYRIFGDRTLIYVFGIMPSVSWSISTEWFFYLAFPLISLAIAPIQRTRTLVILAVIFTLVALGIVCALIARHDEITTAAVSSYGPIAGVRQFSYFRWLIYFSPYSRILEFILGCLTASIFMKLQRIVPDAKEQKFGLVLITGSMLWTAFVYFMMSGISYFTDVPWTGFVRQLHLSFGFAPGLAVMIFSCGRYGGPIVHILSSRLMVLCGEASYSLYLLHDVVIQKMGEQSSFPVDLRLGLGQGLRLMFCVLACIGLSLVTWRLIEVPARRWLRNALWLRGGAKSALLSQVPSPGRWMR